MLVTSSEKFVKHLNNKYDEIIVNGDLDLRETSIQSLPDNLHVKGEIYIKGTPLNDNDELVEKYRRKYTIYRT
jgi:hypothetical protein